MSVVKILLEMGKAFDQLMNLLENKNSTKQAISQSYNNVSKLFAETSQALWPIGKSYLLSQNRRKDKPVIKIPVSQLTELGNMTSVILDVEEKEPDIQQKERILALSVFMKQLKADIEPIFNGINISMHPEGLTFDVKPYSLYDSKHEDEDSNGIGIGIIVKPNKVITKLQEVGVDATEWERVKAYLSGEFQDKMKQYSERAGYRISVHILDQREEPE